MKESLIKNLRNTILCVLTTLFLLSVTSFSFKVKGFVFANETTVTAGTELFLPKSELEYRALSSPIDAYSDDYVTAIIQRDDQSLNIYQNGEFIKPSLTFTDLQQVKKLDDNTLLVSDGVLYTVTLDTYQKSAYMYNESGTSEPVDANFFDFNGEFLIKVYNTVVVIYRIENSLPVNKSTISGCTKAPVAINENNNIFFVKGNNLCSLDLSSSFMSEPNVLLENVVPSHMIAKGDFVYYLFNQKIYKLNITDKTVTELSVQENEKYQLGNILSPASISFKHNNLLITDDKIGAIQEFMVDGEKLVFTGFAIAEDKTAFNRIGKSVKEIEKHGDMIAVLDENKLSIINASESFDSYDKNNFTDYFESSFNGKMPNTVALGYKSALLSFVDEANTSFGSLKLLNLSDKTVMDVDGFDSTTIKDITYQSGYYYALVSKGNYNKIYSADENSVPFAFTETEIPVDQNSTMIAVDVFKNVFVVNSLNSKINKFSLIDNTINEEYSYIGNIKKLTTDLAGGLFALKDNSVLYLGDNASFKEINLEPAKINSSAVAKSFAMDYINDKVYIVYESEEFVYKTEELGNHSISSLSIPETYITTDKNAKFENLKSFAITEETNVYSVTKLDIGFSFNGLVLEHEEEYALITEITASNAFGREIKLLALAGQNGVVLVNANNCTEISIETSDAPKQAFVTTSVHFYYLPISTYNDGYALTDQNKLRLDKATVINPQKTFIFLNSPYYFATVTIDGTTYSGYIPKNFTVEILSQNFDWEHYTIKTVNKTEVFVDKDLSSVIKTLANGEEIRLLEHTESISKIAYKSDENIWVIGYIKSSAITNSAKLAIRNILIILAVAACVCGTTSYFFLRRKINK